MVRIVPIVAAFAVVLSCLIAPGAASMWGAGPSPAGASPIQAPNQTRGRSADDSEQIRRGRLRYLALVQRFCQGEVEAVLDELPRWDWRTFTDVRIDMRHSGEWQLREVECAALMHTEAALRAVSRSTLQTSHFNWARELLRLLDGQPLDQSFRRDWLVAVAALLHGELRFVELDDYLREAGGAFPNDAQILFAWGLLRESQTSKRLEAVARVLPGRTEFSLGRFPNRGGALREAEEFYRRTLALDPSLVEAQLRLGHVLMLRERPDEALKALIAVRDSRADSRLTYLAALFAGQILEQARRVPEARASYRRAADIYPACQVALTASSYVAFKLGRRDQAVALAPQALGFRLGEECDEPWIVYDLGRGPEAEQMFDRLRARVR